MGRKGSRIAESRSLYKIRERDLVDVGVWGEDRG